MDKLTTKILKIFFGVVAFILVTSSSSKGEVVPVNFFGEYTLHATGDYDIKLNGKVVFEQAIETSVNGTTFSTLKLDLKNEENGLHHIGFLISKENESKPLDSRTYKVSKQINGFINHFDGVFGFANINTIGKTPFFANSGKITIKQMDDRKVTGYLEVVMYNSNHKKINVKGSFIASRLKQ